MGPHGLGVGITWVKRPQAIRPGSRSPLRCNGSNGRHVDDDHPREGIGRPLEQPNQVPRGIRNRDCFELFYMTEKIELVKNSLKYNRF